MFHIKKFYDSMATFGRSMLVQKKWWVTSLLIVLLLGAYIILYLAHYKRTEFLYTLF